MEIEIKEATVADQEAIVFGNCSMAKETEDKLLDTNIINKGVNAVLCDSKKGKYYVATCQGKVVGQLMITYEWSDWRNGTFWWIQSVYILKEFRRKGIYRKLYEHVKNICDQDTTICGIRLYVEKNNNIARQTYLDLGMDMTHYDFMEFVKN